MKKLNALLVITMVVLACHSCRGLSSEKIVVTNLVCEYQDNPLGIDSKHPRMSWQINGKQTRNIQQTAYQIIVASTPANLEKNVGDLWDSGKIDSNESADDSWQNSQSIVR